MSPSTLPSLQVSLLNDTGASLSDRITRDSRLRISGLSQGARAQYSLDGVSWLETIPAALEGVNTVWVRQIDTAGNFSDAASLSFTLDTKLAAPIVALMNDTGVSAIDKITSNGALNVTGIEAGAVVQYSKNGTDWTATAPVAAQGLNAIYVRQTDVAGNSAVVLFQFTLDSVASAANLQIGLRSDTGVATDLITRDGAMLVTGIAQSHRVEYSKNGTDWSSVQPAVIEGQNTVYVRQVDVAGNASTGQKFDFVLDTKAAVPIVVLANDTGVSATDRLSSDGALKVTGVEAGATVQYSKDGTTWASTAPTATEGLNIVYVRQVDVTGNISSVNKFSFVMDSKAAVAPTVVLANDTGVSSTDRITTDGTVKVTGIEAGATVQYSKDGVAWGSTIPVAVLGDNSVYVRQVDTAGNASIASSLNFSLIAATTPTTPPPPAATLQLALRADTGIANDLITRDSVVLVNNIGQGNKVEYSSNGTTWGSVQPSAVEGQNTVYVRQVNTTGGASTAQTLSFTLDTKATVPLVALVSDTGASAIDKITSNGALNVTGIEAGATVQYSTNGTTWANTAPVAVQGLNTVYVRQTDVTGNTSASTLFQFNLDNVAAQANLQFALRNDSGVVGDLISRDGSFVINNVALSHSVEYSTNGTTWSKVQPAAVEGQNAVWVRQVDVAGNASTGQKFNFVVDTKAAAVPTVTITDTGIVGDLITNTSKLNVTTEASAKVEYSKDGVTWATIAPVAVEGLNSVYVRQIDVAGNASQAISKSYFLDSKITALVGSLAEDTGVSTTDRITRNKTVQVSGLEAGASWAYQVDGTGAWIAGTGTTFDLTDGNHSYTLRHTDKAGNTVDSTPFSVTAVLNPSAISAQLVDSQGNVVRNGYTSDANATLRLTGDTGDTWQYRNVGEANWHDVTSALVNLPLVNGINSIETRKIDIAGNFVSEVTRAKIDNMAAMPTMTLLEDTGTLGDNVTTNPLVVIGGLEGLAVWEVKIDDQPTWNTWTFNPNQMKLLLGKHDYHVRQTDEAGNVSAVNTYTFTYESAVALAVPKLLADTGVSDGDAISNNATITVGNLDANATWEYKVDDGAWQAGTGSSFEMLKDGAEHNYAVRQQVAGKYSEPQTLYKVLFDNTAPSSFTVNLAADTGNSATDNITNNATLTVEGLEVGGQFEYQIDAGTWVSVGINSASTSINLDAGTHTYNLRQIDKAGNASAVITKTYTYINADVAAPTLKLVEDTGIDIQDALTNNAKIEVTLAVAGDGVSWQYQVDANGTWIDGTGLSFNALVGTHSYQVRQRDVAGNVSPASAALSVKYDATGPVFSSPTSVSVVDADSERQQLIPTSIVLYTAAAADAEGGAVTYSMADSSIFSFDAQTRQLSFKQPVGYSASGNNVYTALVNATDAVGNTTTQQVAVRIDRVNTATPEINVAQAFDGSVSYAGTMNYVISKIQSDGKAVSLLGSNVLERRNVDGTVDISVPVSYLNPTDFQIDSTTGKMYVFSYQTSTVQVNRYNADGTVDSTWGTNGVFSKTDSLNFTAVLAGRVLSDGSVVFVGRKEAAVTPAANDTNSMLWRLNSTGKTLTTVVLDQDATQNDAMVKVALANNNSFMYVQSDIYNESGVGTMYLRKLNLSTNTFDTTFAGGQGKATLYARTGSDLLTIDSQNRAIIVHENTASSKIEISRYLSTGVLDSGFGTGGKMQLAASDVYTKNITIAADDSLYVAHVNTGNKVAHILSNGSLDSAFGVSGIASFAEITKFDAISVKNGKLNILGASTDLDNVNQHSMMQFDAATGKADTTVGDVLLTMTEGNRAIGLLPVDGYIKDIDAANTSYNGVSLNIQRVNAPDSTDVFGARGKLQFSADNKLIWDGGVVGTVSNANGALTLTFDANATQTIVDNVSHAITYTNTSQQPTAKVQLAWTVNDNDSAGAKSTTRIETINMLDDFKDAGDTKIVTTLNNQAVTLTDYVQINGKHYYLIKAVNHNQLDTWFNNGADTTATTRTVTQANGMTYTLLNSAEINAVMADTGAKPVAWADLYKLDNASGNDIQGVWSAELGSAAGQHLSQKTTTAAFVSESDAPRRVLHGALVEVTAATTTNTTILQPQLQLAEDNGDVTDDFITSNGQINILGLDGSVGYRYSINGGQTWIDRPVGSRMDITLDAGTYLKNSILVQQTDLSGFVTELSNSALYKIDKTIKSINLLNDQGLNTYDNVTADNRIVVHNLDTTLPYQYSVDGGNTWQTGGMLNANTYGFTVTDGSYAKGMIRIRQTDANNFTSGAKNTSDFKIDQTVGQGVVKLNLDNGDSSTDGLTSIDKIDITGFRNQAWEYCLNGGNTWQAGTIANSETQSFIAPQGTYLAGALVVRQTDSSGFVTQRASTSLFKIDKFVKAVSLLNDQGISITDNITADGRILAVGLDPAISYQYSTDSGVTWQTGTTLANGKLGFTLLDGNYAVNQVQIRQTDANNFTSAAKNTTAYTVSQTTGQGLVNLTVDTGDSVSDNLTSDDKFEVTGLRGNQAWEYSLNGGSTWQAGAIKAGDKQYINVGEGVFAANAIQARQLDANGYTTVLKVTQAFTVDKTIAQAAIQLVNDTGYSNTDLLTADGRVKFTITGTLNAGDVWKYTTNGGTTWVVGTGSTQTISVANGTYNAGQIKVMVSDVAGNTSTAAFDKRFVVDNTDTTAPVITSSNQVIVIDSDGMTATNKVKSTTVLHTATSTDANNVYYSLSGANANLFNMDVNTGKLTFKNDTNLSQASGDNYAVTVTATDAFNNASTQNLTVKVVEPLKFVSSSVDFRDFLGEGQNFVLTFNKAIELNTATGQIKLGGNVMNLNDANIFTVSGNQLIIKPVGIGSFNIYKIMDAVKALDGGDTWSSGDKIIGFRSDTNLLFNDNTLNTFHSTTLASQGAATSNDSGTVAVIGDVNGDGIDDWAVSFSEADMSGKTDAGKVYVGFGRTDGTTATLANIENGTGGFVIRGKAGGDKIGQQLKAAGDVNGDGLKDILFNAVGANGGSGKDYVVYGKKDTAGLELSTLESNGAYGRVFSTNVKDGLGALGDINHDGYADIAHGYSDIKLIDTWDEVKDSWSYYKVSDKLTVQANWYEFAGDVLDLGLKIMEMKEDPVGAITTLVAEKLTDEAGPLAAFKDLYNTLKDINEFFNDPYVKSSMSLKALMTANLQVEADLDTLDDPLKTAIRNLELQRIRTLGANDEVEEMKITKSGGSSGSVLGVSVPKDTEYTINWSIKRKNTTITKWTETLNGAGIMDVELGGNAGSKAIKGNINGQRLGADATALGDINGDGIADYGILDGGSGGVMAQLNVVYGTKNTDTSDLRVTNITSENKGFRILDSRQTKNYVGDGMVKGLGDVNGDGYADFAVNFDILESATYVVFGKAGLNNVDLAQVANGIGGYQLAAGEIGHYVKSVDAVGDFNGDGLDDFVYYTRYNEGSAVVRMVYGSNKTAAPDLKAISDGVGGFTIYTNYAYGSIEFSSKNAFSAGDINGDGLLDLVMRAEDGKTVMLYGSTDTIMKNRVVAELVGTTSDDNLASTGSNTIVAHYGNDTITTNGADVVLAGAGNDRIILDSSTITALQSTLGNGGNVTKLARVDGGAGFDVLEVHGNISLDFTRIINKSIDQIGIRERVDGIEKIDLATDSTANAVKLTLSDVLDMADSNIFNTGTGWSNVTGSSLSSLVAKHQLAISGTSADTVSLKSGEWSNTGTTVKDSSGEIYNVYNAPNAAAQLMIDKDMLVSMF